MLEIELDKISEEDLVVRQQDHFSPIFFLFFSPGKKEVDGLFALCCSEIFILFYFISFYFLLLISLFNVRNLNRKGFGHNELFAGRHRQFPRVPKINSRFFPERLVNFWENSLKAGKLLNSGIGIGIFSPVPEIPGHIVDIIDVCETSQYLQGRRVLFVLSFEC